VEHNEVRIEQLANRSDLLSVVAGWLYHEWWQRFRSSK